MNESNSDKAKESVFVPCVDNRIVRDVWLLSVGGDESELIAYGQIPRIVPGSKASDFEFWLMYRSWGLRGQYEREDRFETSVKRGRGEVEEGKWALMDKATDEQK